MRLLIKQRVFSWSDTYDIYDENENIRYFVKAEVFALGHQLHVYDAWNNEVGRISQELLTFLPAFEIEVNGVKQGTIQKKFSFLTPKYEIDFNGWRVELSGLGLRRLLPVLSHYSYYQRGSALGRYLCHRYCESGR